MKIYLIISKGNYVAIDSDDNSCEGCYIRLAPVISEVGFALFLDKKI